MIVEKRREKKRGGSRMFSISYSSVVDEGEDAVPIPAETPGLDMSDDGSERESFTR